MKQTEVAVEQPFALPRRRWWHVSADRAAIVALLVVGVMTSAGAFAVHLRQSAAQSSGTRTALSEGRQAPSSAPELTGPTGAPGSASTLSTSINQALSTHSWPQLRPAPDQLDGAKAAELAQCGNVSSANVSACRFGPDGAPATKQAIVIGDSVAISWLPGVRKALEPAGWQVQGLTSDQCPAPRIDTWAMDINAQVAALCKGHQKWALSEVMRRKPALVIMASAENTLRRLPCCQLLSSASTAWQDAQSATAKELASAAGRVVILAPPPEGKGLAECATRLNRPEACVTRISEQWRAMSKADAAAAADSRTSYVDTSSWFCAASGLCPPFVGTTTVFTDGTHLTSTYSARLAPQLASALLSAGQR